MKKIVLLILIICLCISIFSSCGVESRLTYEDADMYTVGGGTVQKDDVKDIHINWIRGNVKFVAGGDSITVSESTDGDIDDAHTVRYYLSDEGELRIQYMESVSFDFGAHENVAEMPEKELTVSIPKGLELANISVKNIDGQVNAEALTANEFNVKTISSDIRLENIKAKNVDVANENGDVSLQQIKDAEKISVDSSSGTVMMSECNADMLDIQTVSASISSSYTYAAKRAKLESTSGDISFVSASPMCDMQFNTVSGKIMLTLDGDGYTVDYDTVSGEVKNNAEVQNGAATETVADTSEVYKFGDGQYKISVRTISGDLTLYRGKA